MISGFGEERVDARLIHACPGRSGPLSMSSVLRRCRSAPAFFPARCMRARRAAMILSMASATFAVRGPTKSWTPHAVMMLMAFGLHRGTVVAVVSRPSVEVRMQLAASSSAVLRMVASSRKTFASMAISAAKDWLVLRRSPNATGAGLRLVGAPDGMALRRVLCANR